MVETISAVRSPSRLVTLAATGCRTVAQASFLLLLPQASTDLASAQVLASFALTAILVPAAALGSQFALIRGVARRDDAEIARAGTFYYGIPLILVATIAVWRFYRPGGANFSLWALGVLMIVALFRLFTDSYLQATGKYNALQFAYVIFWLGKTSCLIIAISLGLDLSFRGYALLDLVCSLPWLAGTAWFLVKLAIFRPVRVSWEGDGAVVGAGLIRGYWLEADRVLLPMVVSARTYVDYTLMTRVTSGALLLIAAYLATQTPAIAAGNRGALRVVIEKGVRPSSFASIGAMAAAAAVFVLYPRLFPEYLPVALIGMSVPFLYLLSSAYADFVFYQCGASARLTLNALGAAFATAGVLVVSEYDAVWLPMLAMALSLAVTAIYGQKLIDSNSRISA